MGKAPKAPLLSSTRVAAGAGALARSRLSRGDAVVLVLVCLWSAVPLAILFLGVPGISPDAAGRGAFTGSSGLLIGDHMQYISWIREAGGHVAFSNRFDVIDDPHLFVHPMWAISGLAWKLGASLQLAFISWKPVGILLLFTGFLLYVRRLVPAGGPWRLATLMYALFYTVPAMWITDWFGVGSFDLKFGSLVMGLTQFPAQLLWEVVPTAISLGLMPLFLLGIERIVDPAKGAPGRSARWYMAWTATAGLFCSWLHPWQGLTLLLVVLGAFVWARFDRRYLALAVPVAATVVPLLYYAILSRTDSAWHTVSVSNNMPHVGAWLFLGLAPLLLLALPGLAERPRDLQERLLLIWPLAALAVYFGLRGSYFYHALAGLSLPLGILAARGWRRLKVPSWAVVMTVAVFTVPGLAFATRMMRDDAPDHFLRLGETAAFNYLARSSTPGAVLAPLELGRSVPAFTGRNTWIGHATWTPDYPSRDARTKELFSGRLAGHDARALVREAGVRFVLSDCHHRADLRPGLRPLLRSVRRFGCATLYEVRRGSA